MQHSTRTSWVIRTVGNTSFFKMSSLPFNCPQVPSTPQQDLIKRLIIICPPSGMDNVFRDDMIEFLGFNVALSTFPVMSGAALSRRLAEGKYESASSPCTFLTLNAKHGRYKFFFKGRMRPDRGLILGLPHPRYTSYQQGHQGLSGIIFTTRQTILLYTSINLGLRYNRCKFKTFPSCLFSIELNWVKQKTVLISISHAFEKINSCLTGECFNS